MENEPQHNPAISVIVVDDHPAVCEGLALLLAPDNIIVCFQSESGAEVMAALDRHRPDLVMVDLSLAGEDGLTLVTQLRELEVPALVYSTHEDGRHIEDAFAAGALGYVTKRELHRVLVMAIREVAAGRRFVSPRAATNLADHLAERAGHHQGNLLSRQELQVYGLLGEGEGTIEIAAALGICTRTVESYYSRIQEKLGLRGMHELRRHAILSRHGQHV